MTTETTNEDYTVEDLLAMDDADFGEAILEDLEHTGHHLSAFQDERVVRRTLTALLDKLWYVNGNLERNKNNLEYSREKWNGSAAFRRYLLATVDITQARMEWAAGVRSREVRAWRGVLNDVLDKLEGTDLEHVLDDLTIPFDNLTLRDWLEIRRAKQPIRIPKRFEVAA